MALSALDDLSTEPTAEQVAAVLGDSAIAWSELESWLQQTAGVDHTQWMSSGKKYGWALRANRGKRAIVYLIPQHGSFLVGMVLGDRAMQAVGEIALSPGVMAMLAEAKRYGEGTGFRLPVTRRSGLEDIRALVDIKLRY